MVHRLVVGRAAQVPSPGPQLASATRGGLRMLLDKKSQDGRGRYTDIWEKRGGQWLAVAAHVTRL
jgi:hypothetical protein